MTTLIRDFWLQNPDFWITFPEKQLIVDKLIYDKFYDYDFSKEDDLGNIIYLDQFLRHFSRIVYVAESTIEVARQTAAKIVESLTEETLMLIPEKELIWYLMPWKHINKWTTIFKTIDKWLQGRPIIKHAQLNRFFMDTYRKAFTQDTVKNALTLSTSTEPYDKSICETYYDKLDLSAEAVNPQLIESLKKIESKQVTISLSGGVDSMLMTALLCRAKFDVIALHIIYGNRKESLEEQKFISNYCMNLGVPLFVYRVEWLKRNQVDRAFYETMTRELRFSTYRAIGRPVLLGHIQEDVIENIWTNLAHGTHLDNLAKLEHVITESDVKIYRPWLKIKKSEIYETAKTLSIPYLKNTTPSWSNRGKFRDHFYTATHSQYGPSVDDKILEVSERIKKQALLLNKLLFRPILNSWNNNTVDITLAIENKLDAEGWLFIFTDLAHNRLGLKKPTFKSCEDFAHRLKKGVRNGQIISLKKDFIVTIEKSNDGKTLLKFSS